MPVTTWTAGQVLAAQDLNDTFASKAGTESPTFSGTVTIPVLEVTNTIGGAIPSPNRNLLYNGAMQVAQRGTSTASITTSGYYTADRYDLQITSFGTWTQSVENDAPTGSGLRKSLKMLCTTAQASPAAGNELIVITKLEGQDLQRVAKGTASAQQMTISFWVKSNVTGTYIVHLYDQDNNRHVASSYSVSASATWEKKSITFPADTTGAFDNDNAMSLQVRFYLGAGSSSTSGTLATAWASYTQANSAVGQTNLAASTNNYWQITGVQLEVGDTATPFEFKSYGQELRECQRYFYMLADANATTISMGCYYTSTAIATTVQLPVEMRTAPTIYQVSGSNYFIMYANSGSDTFDSWTALVRASTRALALDSNGVGASGTAGQAGPLATNNAAARLGFSAEL